VKELLKTVHAGLFLFLFLAPGADTSIANTEEPVLLNDIKIHAKKNENAKVLYLAKSFIKKYPTSTFIPDIYWYIGESESNPTKATAAYRQIVKNFPHYKKRDSAQYRICEIEYMNARYDALSRESGKGMALFPKSDYSDNFSLMLVHSYYHLGQFLQAKTTCTSLIEKSHKPDTLSNALLSLANIEIKISGFSRIYITGLRDLAMGFPKSREIPAALYLIGEFYENRKMRDHAYSSYSALVSKYPKSPEAEKAENKIQQLLKHNPRVVEFLPNVDIIHSTESIDISQEEVPEKVSEKSFFAVSVGPLDSKKSMNDMKKLLVEFDALAVRLKNGYMLYVGTCSTADKALSMKIRLAEEFGINGNIVKFNSDSSKKYIYGE